MDQPSPNLDSYIQKQLKDKTSLLGKGSVAIDLAGYLHDYLHPLWLTIGKLEAFYWDDALNKIKIEKPIYICGLPRAGSTILLETLYATENFASHRYKDFPFIEMPIIWNTWINLLPKSQDAAHERSHLDGIHITPESPEALEEILWMKFFPQAHNSDFFSSLNQETSNPKFEKFYINHIKKMMCLQHKKRYLAKGNYNLLRIAYLHKLFPNARFVVPLRDPVAHVASLMKQHKLFSTMEQKDPRVLRQMQRLGHFEFGLDRRLLNTGTPQTITKIKKLWSTGQEAEGWAHYWSMIYGWLYNLLDQDMKLKSSIKFINFDNLCNQPKNIISDLFSFCDTTSTPAQIDTLAEKIKFPTYYQHGFDENIIKKIREITEDVYKKFGAGEGT